MPSKTRLQCDKQHHLQKPPFHPRKARHVPQNYKFQDVQETAHESDTKNTQMFNRDAPPPFNAHLIANDPPVASYQTHLQNYTSPLNVCQEENDFVNIKKFVNYLKTSARNITKRKESREEMFRVKNTENLIKNIKYFQSCNGMEKLRNAESEKVSKKERLSVRMREATLWMSHSPKDWDEKEVCQWLKSKFVFGKKYSDLFYFNGINGKMLFELTFDLLYEDLKLEKKVHCIRILNEIKGLANFSENINYGRKEPKKYNGVKLKRKVAKKMSAEIPATVKTDQKDQKDQTTFKRCLLVGNAIKMFKAMETERAQTEKLDNCDKSLIGDDIRARGKFEEYCNGKSYMLRSMKDQEELKSEEDTKLNEKSEIESEEKSDVDLNIPKDFEGNDSENS